MATEQAFNDTLIRLQEIDRYEFEDFVGKIFEDVGWEVQVTSDSSDGGVDIVATQAGLFGKKASIQVKRPDRGNKVGQPDVQQYAAIDREDIDTDVVVIATTAPFTRGAYEYGRDYNIKLIDGVTLAGIVEARGLDRLVDEYCPPLTDIEFNEEEVFPVVDDPRDDYLEARPIERAATIFREQDLLDAVDMIQRGEFGRELINALDDFRRLIEGQNGDTPETIFRNHPRLLDQNWYEIEFLDDISDRIYELAADSRRRPGNEDILIISQNEGVSIEILLPAGEEVTPDAFAYLEDCVDFVGELDEVREDAPVGRIYGGELGNIEGKIARHSKFGITAVEYREILTRAIHSTNDLLQAVRPYYRVSDEDETLQKIARLESVASNEAQPSNTQQ